MKQEAAARVLVVSI